MKLNIQKTKELVCRCYDIAPCELQLKCVRKVFFRPRQIISFILKFNSKLTLNEIALEVGLTNHSSIIHGIEKIKNEISLYPVFSDFIDAIILSIKQGNYNKLITPPTEPYYKIVNFTKLQHKLTPKIRAQATKSFKIYIPPPDMLAELNIYRKQVPDHEFRTNTYQVSWMQPNGKKFICQYF